MIKEVICRLKLHLSLNLHKLSVTVCHFLCNTRTVGIKKKHQYIHGPLTQWLLQKVNRIEFHIKPQNCLQIETTFLDLLLHSMAHLQLDVSALLWVTFDISMPRRVFYVNLAGYL